VEELERVRALIEERWEEGPGRDVALRALEELIAEQAKSGESNQEGE
jgi:hypothetical protein